MNLITMSAIAVTLFLGGPSGPALGFLAPTGSINVWVMPVFWFIVKVLVLLFGRCGCARRCPRMRYDQLMALGWKYLIEIAILWVMVSAAIVVVGDEEGWNVVDRRAVAVAVGAVRRVRRALARRSPKAGEIGSRSSADGHDCSRVPGDAAARWAGRASRPSTRGEERRSPARCTAGTSSTATRTAWRSASAASCARACARRGASTCAVPTTRPTSRCRPASATASSTRSTTSAASTATCASRRARPRRSPRRSCSSSRSPTAQRRDLHEGRAARRRRRPRRGGCRGSCGSATRTTHTSGWMRATSPSGDAALRRAGRAGRASSASASRDRAETGSRTEDERRVSTRSEAVAVLFFVCAPRARARRRFGVVLARNPVHSALFLVLTLVSVAVLFPRCRTRDARRGGPDRRLRERDRRAVPVRDHAARRRPARTARGAAGSSSDRPRSSSACSCSSRSSCSRAHDWATGTRSSPAIGNRSQALDAPRPATSSDSRGLFTDYLWAFEITAVLLVIAVVGARRARPPQRSHRAVRRRRRAR